MKTVKFIEKATAKWGATYDYSLVEYVGSKTPVTIICKEHGTFTQRPDGHLSKRQGCTLCAKAHTKKTRTHTVNDFIRKARLVFPSRNFDYSSLCYTGSHTKVSIGCEIHKTTFMQTPCIHLTGRLGCKECAKELRSSIFIDTKEDFIHKSLDVHGHKYDYTQFIYKLSGVKGTIMCTQCSHEFEQSPNSHLNGRGCPSCAEYGFDATKPACLYYLSINNGEAYKIGITNRTVEDRYTLDEQKVFDILHTVWYVSGAEAREEERRILSIYKDYKYTGPSLLKAGNTELFNKDIREIHVSTHMDEGTTGDI